MRVQTLVLLLFFTLCLAGSVLLEALALHKGAWLLKINPVPSFGRSLLANLCLIPLAFLSIPVLSIWNLEAPANLMLSLGMLVVIALVWAVLLRCQWWKALLAYIFLLPIGLVLGLTVRYFVIEAFIVPTGARAPTLLGHHLELHCPNCGYLNEFEPMKTIRSQQTATSIDCPMCGQRLFSNPQDTLHSGDRVLAVKMSQPERWDLIVFSAPHQPETNYVERVVGLPGEQVDLAGGDVFIDGQRLRKFPGDVEDLWILVHDTDYKLKTSHPGGPRWQPVTTESTWKEADAAWSFQGQTGMEDRLVFSAPLTRDLPYNVAVSPPLKNAYVHDVRVTAAIEEFQDISSLALNWSWQSKTVNACLTAASDQDPRKHTIELKVVDAQNPPQIVTAPVAIDPGDRFALAIRDGWAYVTLNNALVVEGPIGSSDLSATRSASPDSKYPCQVYLTAEGGPLQLSRLTIHRDVYYTDGGMGGMPLRRSMKLGPNEHYVLGDNSDLSFDSRYWDRVDPSLEGKIQVGAVPQELIIGVARWVYWPLRRMRELR